MFLHRRNFVCDDGDFSPPLLTVVVTVEFAIFQAILLSFTILHTVYKNTNFPLYFGQENRIFLLPEAFCGLKYAENAMAAGALPRTLLGELTTLPQTP